MRKGTNPGRAGIRAVGGPIVMGEVPGGLGWSGAQTTRAREGVLVLSPKP